MRSYQEKVMSWNLRRINYFVKESKKVIFHRYRSAMVFDIISEFEDYQISKNEKVLELENLLYEKAEVKRRDNHVCFEVLSENGNKLHFMISDLKILIGLGLTEKNW